MLFYFSALSFFIFMTSASAQDELRPIPTYEQQREGNAEINEFLSSGPKGKGEDVGIARAYGLLRLGLNPDVPYATRHAALTHEHLESASDVVVRQRAVDELERLFEVEDGPKMQLKVIERLGSAARSRDEHAAAARRFVELTEHLVLRHRFALAKKAITHAMKHAKQAKENALYENARSMEKWIETLLQLKKKVASPKSEELMEKEREFLLLLGKPPAPLAVGAHARNLAGVCEVKDLSIIAGLEFSEFEVLRDQSWTYVKARALANNQTGEGVIPHELLTARIQLLCLDGNDDHRVLRYSQEVRIPLPGSQSVDFLGGRGGLTVSKVRAYNKNSSTPLNAHLSIYCGDLLIFQSLWHPDLHPYYIDKGAGKLWWEDDDLLVED